MTDEIRVHLAAEGDSQVESAVMDVAMPPSVGEQLRAAREAKRMSVTEIAQRLKLSVRQINALENDDWSTLPGTTIVRGFIRNYARLVRVDSDALMRQLDPLRTPKSSDLDQLIATNNPALPRKGRIERQDLAVVFSGLLLVVLAVLAYFLVPLDFWQSKLAEWNNLAVKTSAVAPGAGSNDLLPSATVTNQAASLGATADSDAESPEKLPPASVPVAPSADSPTNSPTNSPALESGGLKLVFTRPSWVEIRDRSGQVVFSQLNPAGSEREIEGIPPFALIIGNASGVAVQYKGKNIELSQRSKDDVARVNLE